MITIDKKEFLNGITLGGSMAGKAKTVPVLEFVKCTLKGNKMMLTSYDTETEVKKRINVITNEIGDLSFCVSPKELLSILRSVSDDVISFNVDGGVMTIKHKKGELVIPAHNATEFPTPVSNQTSQGCDVSSEMLYNWLKEASMFSSNDEFRAVLCGVHIYMENGEIGVAATDGRRLYCDKSECEYTGEKISCVVTTKSIPSILQAINGTEKTNITIGDTNIEFKNEDSVVRTRIVEGKYPNYLAIVPTNHTSESKIQKNELLDSIKRVLIASDNNSNLVKINAGMCMDLSASDDTFGKKAKETIMCEFSGEALEIGVQGQYLTDCINCVHSDNIIIRLIDPTRPILIKDEDDEDKTLVLMPMRIE